MWWKFSIFWKNHFLLFTCWTIFSFLFNRSTSNFHAFLVLLVLSQMFQPVIRNWIWLNMPLAECAVKSRSSTPAYQDSINVSLAFKIFLKPCRSFYCYVTVLAYVEVGEPSPASVSINAHFRGILDIQRFAHFGKHVFPNEVISLGRTCL